jgi:hypothetical protein
MTGATRPMRRLMAIAYGAILWFVTAIALGDAPSASERGVKPGQKYLANPMTDLGEGPPADCAASEKSAFLGPIGSGEPPSNPDAAEAWDLADLHPGNLLYAPLPPLASGPWDYPACFRRCEPTGTHARGPPVIDQA